MSEQQKERWQGKLIRRYEISCWECPAQDYVNDAADAQLCGWRKIKRKWYCPTCVGAIAAVQRQILRSK